LHVRDIGEIRKLKQQRGKNMHVVGGATLVGSLMNASSIDEVQLMINPLVLGGGKALFKDVKERQALKFVKAKSLKSGKVTLTYSTTV
jgi:dihydrofolate reductase